MARNPIFANSDAFKSDGYATFDDTATRQQPHRPQPPYKQQPGTFSPEQLGHVYAQPSANAAQMQRMTYDDVVIRTGLMFAVLLATAAVSWFTGNPVLMLAGLFGGLVLGLINAIKRTPSPPLMLGYAALEGLFIGGISYQFSLSWDGIVRQAVLATLAVFGVALLAYKSGRVRVTAKSARFFTIAVGGYLLFSLVNLIAMWTGVADGPFGLRSGPVGFVIGLVAVGLAAYSLVMDFDYIDRGVRNGLPQRFAWTAAFGLVVTLVWLYLELLRLIAILRALDE